MQRATRLLALAALLGLGFFAGVAWREDGDAALSAGPASASSGAQGPPGARPVTAAGELDSDERAMVTLFRQSAPSVAYITSIAFRRSVFSLNVQQIPRGTGSGFVWDERGHVVTNYHVVQGSSIARVTLSDKTTWDAEIVGVAPEKDLAVLRIEAPPEALRPIPVGRSLDLLVGQKVFAIGNPFGLDQTLTTGIISALGREIESPARLVIRDVVQTDAAINPGNSGGPLLDSSGRLIGVNTAIYSPSGASAGIGFAIPVDTVAWVVPEIIDKGRIERPRLGVELVSAGRYLSVDGALITRVEPGGGAEAAGLRGTLRDRRGRVLVGDIIVGLDDAPVRSEDDVFLALERRRAGEVVTVTYLRDGRTESAEVRLGPAAR